MKQGLTMFYSYRLSGSGPFSISTSPAATSACLSDARLRSLISARGASLRWAIRCYGWGYLGRFGSLWSRVAPWALAEKKSGVRPNGLGSDRRMGCERRDVGLARHRDALGALDHAADRPAPARELAGGRHVGLVLVDAALEHRGPPADEPSHALGGMAPRAEVLLAFGQIFLNGERSQVVPSRPTSTRRRCFVAAFFVMPPCRTLAAGVLRRREPIHAMNDLAF